MRKIPQEPNDAAECQRLRELLAHQSPKLRIEIVSDEKSKRITLTSGDEDIEHALYCAMKEMQEDVEAEWRRVRAKIAVTDAAVAKVARANERLNAQLDEARAELALLKAEKAAGPGPLFEGK